MVEVVSLTRTITALTLLGLFRVVPAIADPVPEATLYGCYQTVSRMMYTENIRLYYRDQYRHGMRTATASGNGATLLSVDDMALGLARQFDLMVEEGIAQPGEPMLCLSAGWADYDAAKKIGRHVDRWPEVVLGSKDEPSPPHIKICRDIATEVWPHGYRTGTAIAGYNLYLAPESVAYDGFLADWLDMWIVLASTWQSRLHVRAHEATADLCAYWAYPREPDRDRYLTGLWCWKHKPKQFLFWAYTHSAATGILPNGEQTTGENEDPFHMVWPSPEGPLTTPAWEAIREGIEDHALLERLEASGKGGLWLNELRDSIPEVCSVPPKPVPRTDFEAIRKRARRLLEEG